MGLRLLKSPASPGESERGQAGRETVVANCPASITPEQPETILRTQWRCSGLPSGSERNGAPST